MLYNKLFSTCLNKCRINVTLRATLSTTCNAFHNKMTYRKKWVSAEEWPKEKTGSDTIPWLSSLPRKHHPKLWTKEEAYFGMYDNLAILGNDVSIDQRMFCRGPGFVRAFRGNELQRLIKKKRCLGYRMHAEDLHTINKAINYLYRLENRKKKKTHG